MSRHLQEEKAKCRASGRRQRNPCWRCPAVCSFDCSYREPASSIAIRRQQNPVHFNTARYRLLTWCLALAALSGKSICRRALHWRNVSSAWRFPAEEHWRVTGPFTIHGTRLHCRPSPAFRFAAVAKESAHTPHCCRKDEEQQQFRA